MGEVKEKGKRRRQFNQNAFGQGLINHARLINP
jgi:hypothetical protein